MPSANSIRSSTGPTPTISLRSSGAPGLAPATAAAPADPDPQAAFPSAFLTPSTGGLRFGPTGSGRLDGKTVVVDPGHNEQWITSINNVRKPMFGTVGARCLAVGATGMDGKTMEHTVMWQLSEKLVPLLRAQGATVLLTRPDDAGLGPCNDERAEIANRAGADLLVSLHGDGAENQKLRGFYAIIAGHSPGGEALIARSRAAAEKIIVALTEHSQIPKSNYSENKEMPVQQEDFAVVNNLTSTPGVLLEVANVRQADDWAILTSEQGQADLAAGIAEGVADALAS